MNFTVVLDICATFGVLCVLIFGSLLIFLRKKVNFDNSVILLAFLGFELIFPKIDHFFSVLGLLIKILLIVQISKMGLLVVAGCI